MNSPRKRTHMLCFTLHKTKHVWLTEHVGVACFILSNMSSLRNVVNRRAHKERAQPHARKKFELLEKHKDYVKRAQAFHKKEDTLQKIKEKAAFRNPDEFYTLLIFLISTHMLCFVESKTEHVSVLFLGDFMSMLDFQVHKPSPVNSISRPTWTSQLPKIESSGLELLETKLVSNVA